MFERLLVTDDGSPLAEAAIPHAALIARATSAGVVLLTVTQPPEEVLADFGPSVWRAHLDAGSLAEVGLITPERLREEAARGLAAPRAALEAAGVLSVTTLVREGSPGPAIVKVARDERCDLIVIASHGRSGFKRAVLGSVADHVVRHAAGVPVLVCRATTAAPPAAYRYLLLPQDGSEHSRLAIAPAAALASATGAEVVLLRAIDSVARILAMSTPAGYPMAPPIPVDLAEQVVAFQRQDAIGDLEAAAERLGDAGAHVRSTEIIEGLPGPAIVEAAERLECDLIAMATHGRGGLGRALLGSVADFVARNTTLAPVLMVRPADDPETR
jgi:nucleotide-binding universal stress UspA family protein